jgi:cytochrome c-type biogenesis protein CcmH
VKGDSDKQVIDYLVARYGNYVLLKPPFQADTLFLWFGPAVILAIAAAVFGLYVRGRRFPHDQTDSPLTEIEREQFAAVAKDFEV